MRAFERSFSLQYWLNYIESLHPEEIVLGLDRVKSVAEKADLLTFKCPIVLIGGTNGKGSTVHALATLLKETGLKVGSYFSPHLVYFNERIRINGECIQDYQLCQVFSKIEQSRLSTSGRPTALTFFEFTTLAALEYFKQMDCDIILLEVGLGGRLDAVNIVEPILSVITTLGLDHTDRLGNTLEQIAIEKSGIFRKNKPAFIGKGASHPQLLKEANRQGAHLMLEGKDFGWETNKIWHYLGHSHTIPSHKLPASSLSLALAVFNYLEDKYPQLKRERINPLNQVLMKAALPGRFQKYFNKVETILDVAHNPLGAQWLADKLNDTDKNNENIIAVWSSFNDKDLKGIIAAIHHKISKWVIAPLNHHRAASLEVLQSILKEQGVLFENIFCESTIDAAYKKAYSIADENNKILVFGSCMTVSEVMISLPSSLLKST